MTKETESIIDRMNPGPAMDLLISKIIGKPASNYSTDIKAAWTVVEWCMDYAAGDLFIEYWQDGEWFICNKDLWTRRDEHYLDRGFVVTARSDNVGMDADDIYPSLPLAICRYAFKIGIRQDLIKWDEQYAIWYC